MRPWRWLYGKIFRKFRKGDKVVWHTHPLCPYQGQEGWLVIDPFRVIGMDMTTILWEDGTENTQPTSFLRRIP